MDDCLVCMFRTTMCPSAGEITVSMRHLAFVTLCGCCIPDSHPHRVTNTKCHTDTVISPDDGHIVTQNMNRKEIYILRKIVHQVGFIYMTLESIFTVTVVTLLTNCLCGQFGARVILSSNHFNLHRRTRNSTTRPDEMSCSYYPY